MANTVVLASWRKRWNRSLLRFLGRRVAAPIDIEDLAQETYLRLLRARDLSDVRNPEAYLLTVASHVITEWRQKITATESLELESVEPALIDHQVPELQLEATLSQHRLTQALASMSPTMRAIVLLRLRDERPLKEIANELNLTLRQVRRYLARGYERLRGAIE